MYNQSHSCQKENQDIKNESNRLKSSSLENEKDKY